MLPVPQSRLDPARWTWPSQPKDIRNIQLEVRALQTSALRRGTADTDAARHQAPQSYGSLWVFLSPAPAAAQPAWLSLAAPSAPGASAAPSLSLIRLTVACHSFRCAGQP